MNKVITDREDLFWAKMAGRDVDISTMTPPVASSMREELMLEVAERIAQGGGGGGGSDLPAPGDAGNVLTSTGTGWESAPPQGGSGGTSDYDDLENKPVSVETVELTNDMTGTTGEMSGTTLYKIADDFISLDNLLGATVNGNTTLTSANTMEMSDGVHLVFYSPSSFEQEPPLGLALISLDAPFVMQDYGINVPSAGVWADETIETVALLPQVSINEDYATAFLPQDTAGNIGSAMQTDENGKWTVGAQIPVQGVQSWREIKRNVKLGRGATLYPVHTILNVRHKKFGSVPFEVVAHDVDTDPDDNSAHTMTLLALEGLCRSKSTDDGYCFDETEKFAVCPSGLVAGSYYFDTNGSSSYINFTLTQNVPSGGYLAIVRDNTTDEYMMVSCTSAGAEIESVAMGEEKSGDYDLAETIGASNINNYDRARYGSGNYKQSAIRQWLNADSSGWWEAQTDFDLAPNYIDDEGFLAGIDSEFASILLETEQTVGTNDVYEVGDGMSTSSSYTVSDKVFLASYTQVGGTAYSSQAAENTLWTAFNGLSASDELARVKYRHGTVGDDETAVWWWLRSPYPYDADGARRVDSDGDTHYSGDARYRSGAVVPACVI